MSSPPLGELLVAINKPNLVTFPEQLISALVNERMHSHDGPWSGRFVYNWPDAQALPTVDGRVLGLTYPKSDAERQLWIEAVKTVFEVDGNNYGDLADALADELQGVKATNSPRISAIPITPSTSLLQSYTGVIGSKSAERFDQVLNQIFAAGAGPLYAGPTAGELLIATLRARMATDGFLIAIERAVRRGILSRIDASVSDVPGEQVSRIAPPGAAAYPAWLMHQTPFAWFKRSWEQLMSDEWSAVLPARRWVDWVSTVARLAIGFSELWQARMLDVIGEFILSDEPEGSIEAIKRSMKLNPLINWQDGDLYGRARNVQVDIRTLITRGALIESFIDKQVNDGRIKLTDDLDTVMTVLRTRADRKTLNEVLANRNKLDRGKNRRAAVESCLTARSTDGEHTDHYGFLVQKGPSRATYRIVDPSTEVIAILASLSCGSPNNICTVGDVRRDLRALGLEPSVPELVSRLVRAGLSTKMADASDAIEVHSAFRGVHT